MKNEQLKLLTQQGASMASYTLARATVTVKNQSEETGGHFPSSRPQLWSKGEALSPLQQFSAHSTQSGLPARKSTHGTHTCHQSNYIHRGTLTHSSRHCYHMAYACPQAHMFWH